MTKFKPFVIYAGRMDYSRLWGVSITWGLSQAAVKYGKDGYYELFEGIDPYRHYVCVAVDLWCLSRIGKLIHWSAR